MLAPNPKSSVIGPRMCFWGIETQPHDLQMVRMQWAGPLCWVGQHQRPTPTKPAPRQGVLAKTQRGQPKEQLCQWGVQHGKEGMANIHTRLPPKVLEGPGDHRDS